MSRWHQFTIKGHLPSFNKLINLAKGRKMYYSKLKKQSDKKVEKAAKDLPVFKNKIWLDITYYCKSKRKDKDNIAVAKKFILDGLIRAGKLENDGWGEIEGWKEVFIKDKENPRVVVKIKEQEEGEDG